MTTYSFTQQLATGEIGEQRLDNYFSRWFVIRAATAAEQRQGIDRVFTGRADARCYAVEYKTDHMATITHNAFVETVSVDTAGKLGWVYTSRAQWLLYYVPDDELVYIIDFAKLRPRVATWALRYPVRKIKNQGYYTHGLLVPLDEFERLADNVVCL